MREPLNPILVGDGNREREEERDPISRKPRKGKTSESFWLGGGGERERERDHI